MKLDRRTLLRGSAGVALGLPWLEAMGLPGRGVARAAGLPKRFIVFFTPNGTLHEAWSPRGTDTDFTQSRILAPLAAYRDYLVVIDGVDNQAATSGPGDDHQRGMGTMLTGTELLPGTFKGGCPTCPLAGYAGGISVDQEIVRNSVEKTRIPSLELGVQPDQTGTVYGYASYAGANRPLPPESSPAKVFQRVFANFMLPTHDPAALLAVRAERKSVLDAVATHYQLLSAKLGAEDREKLDAHLTGVRELETRLAASSPTPMGGSCAKPAAPTATSDFPTTGRLHMDLLVMAMACDQTRVGTIQWQNSAGNARYSWLGATRSHHEMSHDPDERADTKEMLIKINVWLAEQLAYLLRKLKAIPEGTGNMLDNTLILWCNELTIGNRHTHPDAHFVLAGKAGGAIKTGRRLTFSSSTRAPHNNLLVSILNAMDVPAKTFGNPKYCTGPLAGL